MSDLCQQLDAFADGELAPDEAEAFRDHLAGCAPCRQELGELVGLTARARALPPAALVLPTRARGLRWPTLLVAALSLGALVAVVRVSFRSRPRSEQPLALATTRGLEARLSHPLLASHRPYSPPRDADVRATRAPLAELARLEAAGDPQGVAGLYLEHRELGQAEAFLATLPATAPVQSDRAALALSRHRPAEALAYAAQALALEPALTAAQFNRALALRDLGLPRAAAEAFAPVVAARESGWADEARARADTLREEAERAEADLRRTLEQGYAMVGGAEPIEPRLVAAHPGLARLFAYDALRAAPDSQRIASLGPLVSQLDRLSGRDDLARAAAQAARGPFPPELVDAYRRLASHPGAGVDPRPLLAKARSVGREDLALGLALYAGEPKRAPERYAEAAARSGDRWFELLALQQRAAAAHERSDPADEERVLRELVARCPIAGLEFRCSGGATALAKLLTSEKRLDEARPAIEQGERWAATAGDRTSALELLALRAEQARLEGRPDEAIAYLEERRLREPESCAVARFVHLAKASIAFQRLDARSARSEIAATPSCGEPLPLQGVMLLADLQRLGGDGAERERLARELAAWGTPAPATASGLLQVAAARAELAHRPAEVRTRLASLLAVSATTPLSPDAKAARTYAFATAITASALEGAFDEALRLALAELGRDGTERCVAAVSLDDERLVWSARGPGAAVVGVQTARTGPAELSPRAPPSVVDALAGCAEVGLIARAPLASIPGLLPESLAVRRLLGPGAVAPERGVRRRLVVFDARPPSALGLPALAARPNLEGAQVLSGPDATPARVLAALDEATLVELHVHGFLDGQTTGAARLALSPDASGRFALAAEDLRGRRLRGAPLVVLAACRASSAAPWGHETHSLPSALLEAGARGVLASAGELPDAGAPAFFDAVLARVERGEAPAEALRDERVAWLARGEAWVSQVMLFQ